MRAYKLRCRRLRKHGKTWKKHWLKASWRRNEWKRRKKRKLPPSWTRMSHLRRRWNRWLSASKTRNASWQRLRAKWRTWMTKRCWCSSRIRKRCRASRRSTYTRSKIQSEDSSSSRNKLRNRNMILKNWRRKTSTLQKVRLHLKTTQMEATAIKLSVNSKIRSRRCNWKSKASKRPTWKM